MSNFLKLAIISAILVGCKPVEPSNPKEDLKYDSAMTVEFTKSLSDGRKVVCIRYREVIGNGIGGGLSCDWSNAK